MIPTVLALIGLFLAAAPCALFLANLRRFVEPAREMKQPPGDGASEPLPEVSVLIPARDEATGIRDAVTAALASERVRLEVVVLDDDSSDSTPEIVKELAAHDERVRLVVGKPLPEGWNGKQHACWQLAAASRHDCLVFLDADVRLHADALWRMTLQRQRNAIDLLSAFPHQETGTLLEHLVIPMMHIVLLGFLPIDRMRRSRHPAYAAGCGQFFLTTRDAYRRAGTHATIRQTRHDGLRLPRAYRQAGLATDIVDGTSIADCRMYRSATEVIGGVLKNAHEGIANARLILPFTVVFLGGIVLPLAVLPWAISRGDGLATLISAAALTVGWLPRCVAAIRFRQSLVGAALHPFAVLLFIALQWIALIRHQRGRTTAWRGRTEA